MGVNVMFRGAADGADGALSHARAAGDHAAMGTLAGAVRVARGHVV
jgi:hypothetical protein